MFYFHDESNENEKYFRNYIRKNFSNAFVSEFHQGLKRSFSYLKKIFFISMMKVMKMKNILEII
ncbi:hypothetical protein LKX65_06215 [Campylobacter jejuni]|nr:hypothetical protein [Campylobacter jejuni]